MQLVEKTNREVNFPVCLIFYLNTTFLVIVSSPNLPLRI
ncbi:hypothetical protein AX016_0437 [Cellulophaga sp. RHA19]|nr:hypothetical protein AX016_0437 [Cellulophaga sp. RHA19]